MELLERVVREDVRVRSVCDLQDERVAAPDRTCRGCDQFTVQYRFFICRDFFRVDAMSERCIDDDGDVFIAVLREQRAHRVIELLQARRGAAFGRDVRAIHNDMV